MKKLIKNKFFGLIICVLLISGVYWGIDKLIDEYSFEKNSSFMDENGGEILSDDALGADDRNNSGLVDESEIDLELEGSGDAESAEGDSAEIGEGENVGAVGDESNADSMKKGEEPEKIYVYITGEVNVPGVVILNSGSRIADAINAAGGTTPKANVSKVNLVYVLADGMKVNIPNSNDLKNNPDFEYITMSSGDGASDGSGVAGSGSGGKGSGGNGAGTTGSVGSGFGYDVVNINSATQTELESLPGIGPSLALKIIEFRNQNGKFSSIDEIKNVSGIGDAKFESLKKYIRV